MDEYLYGHKFVNINLMPKVSALYDRLLLEYPETLCGIYLFRNDATRQCVHFYNSPPFSGILLEFILELNNTPQAMNCAYHCVDELTLLFPRKKFHLNVHHKMHGGIDGVFHRRFQYRSLCIRNQKNDKRTLSKEFLTMAWLAENYKDFMSISYFIRKFPFYSWDLKKQSLLSAPEFRREIPIDKYQKWAALAHLWAVQNYIDIPEWVYLPIYRVDKNPTIDSNSIVPVQFQFHGLDATECEFINV